MSVRGAVEAKHLQITTAASNDIARPGLRIALSLDIEMKPKMHVYAPGVQGYIPIDWRLDEGGPAAKRHSFEYPHSEMLRLEAIGETVPVYRGHIRHPPRDHFRTGGRSEAAGESNRRSDHQGIVPLSGVRRPQVLRSRRRAACMALQISKAWIVQRAPSEFQHKPN